MCSLYDFPIDNTNFGSSSSITFPVLQRTAEEKILNSDRLTLERWEGDRAQPQSPRPWTKVTRVPHLWLQSVVGLGCWVRVFLREELCPVEKCSEGVLVMSTSIQLSPEAGRFLICTGCSCDSWRKTLTECEATSVEILVWSQHKTST